MHLLFLATVLTVKLVVQRSSLDLLDTLPIAVVVQNPTSTPQSLRFIQPAEYAIELRASDGTLMWSSPGSARPVAPAFPAHSRTFAPGSTTLAVYDWNQLLGNGSSPPYGTYTLRARLIGDAPVPESSVRVTFVPPLSPSTLPALRAGEDFTLVGRLDEQRAILTDEHGSATLSHRLLAAPSGTLMLVRGFVAVLPGGSRVFNVERWAVLSTQPASAR
ncbi:MAG TPA: hypothetical protein VGG89_10460 [Candidatus Baltobacteraceae bacterium]